MASNGYPDKPISNHAIIHLPMNIPDNAKIFHAGTRHNTSKDLIANGGRVLNITATGETIIEATKSAYDVLASVKWNNCFYRKDIAYREIARVSKQ
jgi:phosphoribosylamine--glycine ligase